MGILLAADAAGGTGSSVIMLVVYIAIFGGIMYFMIFRPQKKEQNRVSAMLADLAVGDSVLTSSGFYGTVIDIQDDTVIVEFGSNKNCRIPMQKNAIAQVEKSQQ